MKLHSWSIIFNKYFFLILGNEHDDRSSRPSTSRGGGGYPDRHGFNKKVTFKANNRGGNHYRKSWDNKTDLVREQLDSNEFSNRNGQSGRNNSGRRYFINFIIFLIIYWLLTA